MLGELGLIERRFMMKDWLRKYYLADPAGFWLVACAVIVVLGTVVCLGIKAWL